MINTLVLQHVTEAEQITVTDEEIEAELEQMLSGVAEAETPNEAVRDQLRENIRGSMMRNRTVERLEQIALPITRPVSAATMAMTRKRKRPREEKRRMRARRRKPRPSRS